ncbi:transcriptional regulator, MarR family [Catenulispora acidiphila DSM 44928]|jgi:DNA-binding MarR family transcriptional regulator|uniref:Transcriptional regulator, MarR family n=1 Tax=Catenulispora acidiphila (strain DSM 44928 / JCM 14897 / NBRC 102108 / NRRL B-24433 / ID139908) TaxID=479433 RepID=C7PVC1_CATAD|nr:MarR family transcriptional regulator [Catenulispora acidiphila]ACU69277.1 transcriptional regulator, MarR family [Catenulispora acidiphila DSM 44928]
MSTSDKLGEDGVVSFAIRHVWLGMRAVIEDELTEFGLTVPQFATLMMLDSSPGLTVAEVARACGTTRQSANEMVAGLESRGLVERAAHPTDRRAHQLHATEAGLEMYAKARPAVRRREEELEAGLSPQVRQAAREWMAAIAISCGLPDKK